MQNPEPIDLERELHEFDATIEKIRLKLNEINVAVGTYKIEFHRRIQQYKACSQQVQSLSVMPQTPQNVDHQKIFSEQRDQIWFNINQNCCNILSQIQTVIEPLNDAKQFLIDNRLKKWKFEQILLGYGDFGVKSSNLIDKNLQLRITLDEIQKQFEILYECVWMTQVLLKTIQDCHSQAEFVDILEANLSCEIAIIQRELIWSSFIVEQQPEQVIHIDVRWDIIDTFV